MYQRDDLDWGTGGGGAAVVRVADRRAPAPPRPRFVIAVDLGAGIGSPRWLRGAATLAAMIAALLHVAPGVVPLPAPVPAPLAPAAADEMRAIGIAPLARGADSGRRIAPTDRAQPLTAAPERPRVDLVLTLRDGDGLASMLRRADADAADAAAAARMIAAAGPIAPGTRVAVTLGRRPAPGAGRPIAAVSLRAALDLALAVRRVGTGLVLARTPIAVDETPLRIVAPVGGSLYRTLRGAGVTLPVLADYLRAIAGHVDLDEIMPDDRVDLVVAHRRAAGGASETGRLLYAGLRHDGAQLRLLRWAKGAGEQWFDADGLGARRADLSLPVHGRLTSGFGMRFHPILGYSRMHQGIDLAAPAGTPIAAAADGVVAFAGWHGGHGNYVRIGHAAGLATGYGHMSRFLVAAGAHVRQGELIGYVGSTGLSTGPHCHFEVFRGGVPIDPTGAHLSTAPQIAGADLARFKATLARFQALPAGA